MCAQAHRASLAEMPTAWPGAAPHPPTTVQATLKTDHTAEVSVTGRSGTGSISDKECLGSHLLSWAPLQAF